MAGAEREDRVVALRRLLGRGGDPLDPTGSSSVGTDVRPEDVAAALAELPDDELASWAERLAAEAPELAAEVLPLLGRHDVRALTEALPAPVIAGLVGRMPADDATFVLELASPESVQRVLGVLEPELAAPLRERLELPEDSAARLMSDEYLALRPEATAGDAIRRLQQAGEDVTVFYVYLTDPHGRLVGVVSLRRLLRVPPDRLLADLSPPSGSLVRVHLKDDQEKVAHVVAQQDLVGVPVVDDGERLVGVITHDDVLDVMREEATEDILRLAGTGVDEVIQQTVWSSARARAPWLLFCLLGQMGTVEILSRSEVALGDLFIALALFMPAIVAMGGNVGTQAATIVVRGLATGRIHRHDSLPVLWREVRTSLVMAMTYGALLFGLATLLLGETPRVAGVVALGLFSAMVIASLFGTLVPIGFHALGVDPAVATGPLVTTAMDVVGIGTYFGLAVLLLLGTG